MTDGRDWLKERKNKVGKRPDLIVVVSPEGGGKTSFGAEFPGSSFVMTKNELGLLKLIEKGLAGSDYFPEVDRWEDVVDVTKAMIRSADRPRTAVFDTANGAELLLQAFIDRTKFDGEMSRSGFLNFTDGPKAMQPAWSAWLSDLDALRAKGTTVVLLCHAKTVNFKNPEGADFHRYVADMHELSWSALRRVADLVCFLNFTTEVADVQKSSGRGKGKGGKSRTYHFERSAAWDAKNRHGLPPKMFGKGSSTEDFKEFAELVKKGRAAKAESTTGGD